MNGVSSWPARIYTSVLKPTQASARGWALAAVISNAVVICTGAAVRLTTRPAHGAALAVTFAVLSIWIGLSFSYAVPRVPPSFGIIAVATLIHALSFVRQRPAPAATRRHRAKWMRRQTASTAPR